MNPKQKTKALIAVAAITILIIAIILFFILAVVVILWTKPVSIEGVPTTSFNKMEINYCPRPSRTDCYSFKYDRNSTISFSTKTKIKNWNSAPVTFYLTASVHFLSASVMRPIEGNRIAVGGNLNPFTLGPGAESEFTLNATTTNMIPFNNILGFLCALNSQSQLDFGTTITATGITYIASKIPDTSFENSPTRFDSAAICAQAPDNCQLVTGTC